MKAIVFPIIFAWMGGYGQSAHLTHRVAQVVDADSALLAGFFGSTDKELLVLQLRGLGMSVASGGGWVVAVMSNGVGPEVECEVGLDGENGLPVCSMIGVARVMVTLKQRWRGTLIMVGGSETKDSIQSGVEFISYCVKSGSFDLLRTFDRANFSTRSARTGVSLARIFPASGTVGKTGFGW